MDVVVVTDLDRTFTAAGTVPPAHVAAVAELRSGGVDVVAATGRRQSSASRMLAAAGLVLPTVSLNGACGVGSDASRFRWETFTSDAASGTVAAFSHLGLDPLCFVDDHPAEVWCNVMPVSWFDFTPGCASVAVVDVADRCWGCSPGLFAVSATLNAVQVSAGMLADLVRALGAWSTVAVSESSSGGVFVDASPFGVDKWSGVCAFVGDRSGVVTVAVGDGGNDVAMLEAADVAVGVAGSEVLSLVDVDVVIAPPEQGGWVDVVSVVAGLR